MHANGDEHPIAPRDQTLLTSALEAYDAGESKQAESILNELATRYPAQFEVVETLGLIYAERGEVERAVPLLEAGAHANPSSAEATANLGTAYLRANRLQQAVQTLERAVSLDPDNAQTQSNYGHALMFAKRPAEAALAFRAAVARDPHNPDLLYNSALAEFDSGNTRQASQVLARIPPQMRPVQADSLCGDIEEAQGHFDLALGCFQNAAKREPSEPNLNALAQELLKHWSFEPAIKIYNYAIAQYPSSGRLQRGLGIALYGTAQYEKAAQVFAGLLVAAPNDAAYAKLLGESCIAVKHETAQLCEALLTYTRKHPNDAVAARLAAGTILAWHDVARYGLARQLLESAIREDPRSSDGYYRLGVLDQEEEKWSDSVALLKRAAALKPEWSKVHVRLAQAYSRLGEHELAHREAAAAKQFRSSEDEDMDNQRKELKTFILDSGSPGHVETESAIHAEIPR